MEKALETSAVSQSKVESPKTLSIKPLGADIAVNGKRYRRVANYRRR
jgi:hypothetical protein